MWVNNGWGGRVGNFRLVIQYKGGGGEQVEVPRLLHYWVIAISGYCTIVLLQYRVIAISGYCNIG
jgi:hypothetical protein